MIEQRERDRDAITSSGTDATGIHEVPLPGCGPIPLAGYLKALGVLRLVAEQADPDARGYWKDEQFVLCSRLDAPGLRRFLLEEYRPTPVLAPWNGGSGFFFREGKLNEKDPKTGKKKKTGIRDQPTQATRTLDQIHRATTTRFRNLQRVIDLAKTALAEMDLDEAPKAMRKDRLIARLRSQFPEEGVRALDSLLVLANEETKYPPLWGTGGTDGNLDFTNNFMQRLVTVIDPISGAPRKGAADWLTDSLFATGAPNLPSSSVGQFAPGAAGGPNQVSGFDADKPPVNPWDFILMLEGALLFATAATKRLESAAGSALSYPFTVRTTAAGTGSTAASDEKNPRHEFWAPLWSAAMGLPELRALLAEGRVTLGRKAAKE
ncbi:type I-G CRISPR-associated protein Cas8g1/Csx17 [Arhodomonas sp. SL1]|uniref:type I-G CRISPR-associated protein Cas8g1/Csx17 n=1 Tax=Arhodomonas sp. SL1 TaxID=3425691 RepID=UPI003F884386